MDLISRTPRRIPDDPKQIGDHPKQYLIQAAALGVHAMGLHFLVEIVRRGQDEFLLWAKGFYPLYGYDMFTQADLIEIFRHLQMTASTVRMRPRAR